MLKIFGDAKKNGRKETGFVIRYPFTGSPVPPSWKILDRYPLNAPFAYALIAEDASSSSRGYFLDELPLTRTEAAIYTYLLDTLESELSVPRSEVNPKDYFAEQARKIVKKYNIRTSQTAWSKILYYAERDLVGFAILDGLMRDPNIEDITVDAVGKPVFIYHRKYENLQANIVFAKDEELDNLISRLSHMAGRHISTAFPIVQGTLPGRHRLAATFRREVSPYGGTLTIRKFREDPITIVDMLNMNVLDHRLAAYLWLLMENRSTAIVAGATGSGKTTLLNAILTLTKTNSKIVTIEEVQEINIAHVNWSALVSRQSYGSAEEGAREVGLFDLVKAAMRMRPDILVVGEVRGEEAYVLFQAIASVTGDTPVLVREGGEVALTSIGQLVDRFYRGDAERVPVNVSGIEVLSFDSNGNVLFQPVTYVLRHRADEIYSLRYAGGGVRATGSHSVFVIDEYGNIVEKPVSALREGEALVSFCGSQIARETPVVNVERILAEVDGKRLVREKLIPMCPSCGSSRIIKKGHYGGNQRYSCNGCGHTFMSAREGLVFRDVMSDGQQVSMVSFSKSHQIPKLIEVDRLFARVLGAYLADGCVKHHKGSSRVVFCFGKEEKTAFADDVVEFFSRFGVEPYIDDRGTYAIFEFNTSPLARVFEYLCGGKLQEKRIPSFIWTAHSDIVDAFLDGWRADSRRTVKRRFDCYTSTRRDLLNAISWLGRLNNRTTMISERSSKYRAVYVSKPGTGSKSESIPASLLRNLRARLGSTAWYYCPKPTCKTISKKRARKALQEILAKKRAPLDWQTSRLIDRIRLLLDGSLIASTVLKIERKPFDGFVYDISVPGTESFFGGESPVALHNTGHGGLGTLHADDAPSAIQRLTSAPMNVPESFIPFLDLILSVRRVAIAGPGGTSRIVRRLMSVDEVISAKNLVQMFAWDPTNDKYAANSMKKSVKLGRLAKDLGMSLPDIIEEINRRGVFLRWLQNRGVRNYRDLSAQLESYATRPKQAFELAMKDLGLVRVADSFEEAQI